MYLLIWALTGLGLVIGWSVPMNSFVRMLENSQVGIIFGAILIISGIYQFTALKNKCIGYCESPLSFFMRRWSNGKTGVIRMGAYHGIYCLGCCWPYFLIMIALGWMSLVWMGLFAFVIFVALSALFVAEIYSSAVSDVFARTVTCLNNTKTGAFCVIYDDPGGPTFYACKKPKGGKWSYVQVIETPENETSDLSNAINKARVGATIGGNNTSFLGSNIMKGGGLLNGGGTTGGNETVGNITLQ